MAEEKEVGKVTHYFSKIGVCVIKLSGRLAVGDSIHIKGATTDFQQKANSVQIEHEQVEEAEAGKSIGLKVNKPVREHDVVYKIEEETEEVPVKKTRGRPKKK